MADNAFPACLVSLFVYTCSDFCLCLDGVCHAMDRWMISRNGPRSMKDNNRCNDAHKNAKQQLYEFSIKTPYLFLKFFSKLCIAILDGQPVPLLHTLRRNGTFITTHLSHPLPTRHPPPPGLRAVLGLPRRGTASQLASFANCEFFGQKNIIQFTIQNMCNTLCYFSRDHSMSVCIHRIGRHCNANIGRKFFLC